MDNEMINEQKKIKHHLNPLLSKKRIMHLPPMNSSRKWSNIWNCKNRYSSELNKK